MGQWRTNSPQSAAVGTCRGFGRSLGRYDEGQTPFTPALTTIIATNEASKLLKKEGIDNVIARHKKMKEARERLREMGWRVVVLWECDINADPVAAVQKLATLLSPQDSAYQYPMPGRRELLKVAEDRLQRKLGGQRDKQT